MVQPHFINYYITTLSSGISDTDTVINLTDSTGAPDPDVAGEYWLTIWNAAQDNPDDAGSNAEVVRVTDLTGSAATIIRGERGETAVSHSSGDKVALLLSIQNIESLDVCNVVAYGADREGNVDSTAACQNARNASRETGKPEYWPQGTYLISGKIEEYTGIKSANFGVNMFGDGRDRTIILDDNTSDVCMEFIEDFMPVKMRDVKFSLNNNKPTQDMLSFFTRTSQHNFSDLEFDGESRVCKTIMRFTTCWEARFAACAWKSYNATAVRITNDTDNGGNFTFDGSCNHIGGRLGYWLEGTSVNNNIRFNATKFAFVLDGDHKSLTSGETTSFTSGATTINIGSGHTNLTANQHALIITNGLGKSEMVLVSAYDSGTGDATLQSGLELAWNGEAVELFIGSYSIMTGSNCPGLSLDSVHMESAPAVFNASPGLTIDGLFASTLEKNYFDNQTSYPINIINGIPSIAEIGGLFSTDKTDEKHITLILNSESGNQPGPVVIKSLAQKFSGSTSVPISDPVLQIGTSNARFWYLGDKNIINNDVGLERLSTNNLQLGLSGSTNNVLTVHDFFPGRKVFADDGGWRYKVKVLAQGDHPYTIDANTDYIVLAYGGDSGTFEVTLPSSPTIGDTYVIAYDRVVPTSGNDVPINNSLYSLDSDVVRRVTLTYTGVVWVRIA